ncbi:hypothetical protein Pcinc_028299 [Petrolisthes cinctipes]|uniref:Uncharacterized protein n=1 Tax=Petrolisthes cinctipes TaxID=88211 RepID=A0AAE1F379_PETCI|nr:hypothetical protein Pcinc_028299 [Petrolisthes cinctipes]
MEANPDMTSGRDLKVGKKARGKNRAQEIVSELDSNPNNSTHENQREVKIPNHNHVPGGPSLTLTITATSAPPRPQGSYAVTFFKASKALGGHSLSVLK